MLLNLFSSTKYDAAKPEKYSILTQTGMVY